MTYIKLPVPRIPQGLGVNLLGVAGLLAIVFAVGGLTHNGYWALLTGGVFAVALVVIAQLQEREAAAKPAGANVTPIEPAKRGRISVTAAAMEAAKAETG